MESVKLCPVCGAGSPPNAFFCEAEGPDGRCGAPLADQPVVTREAIALGGESEAGAEQRPQTTVRAWIALPNGRIDVTGGMVLGRAEEVSPASGRLVPYPTISRRHAEILHEPDGYRIRDLGSTNGTFVNGTRIASGSDYALASGDQIALSPEIETEFEIEHEEVAR